MNYIKQPFIPNNQVKLMAVDSQIPEKMLNKLASFGIDFIFTPVCHQLYDSIQSHPDVQIHPLGSNQIVICPNTYADISSQLNKYSFDCICGQKVLESNYPENIAYNVARVGDYIVHKTKFTDTVIREILQESVAYLNTNQGYSKCSVAIINTNTIITTDKSIKKVASDNEINALLIRPGNIGLKNKEHGFIGGCAGLISPDILAVTGTLRTHPDYTEIKEFLKKQKISILELSNEPPIDYGSLIPLLEI
jgi:hypothetical protein